MTILEMLFETGRYSEFPLKQYYDYYTIDPDGGYILLRWKTEIPYFTDRTILEVDDVKIWLPCIYNAWGADFISYEELEPYMLIQIEMDEPVEYKSWIRKPLICVRGTCDGCCDEIRKKAAVQEKQGNYCLWDIFPCTNNRPDWNIWSKKWPIFWDLLFDVVDWIRVCKTVDALVVMFFCTPSDWDPELMYNYGYGLKILGNTIRVIPAGKQLKQQYQNYNTKYPTEDRKIEAAINSDMEKRSFRV